LTPVTAAKVHHGFPAACCGLGNIRLGQPRSAGQILSIQYLRAAAALGVVAFHAAQRAGIDLRTGAAGVDVFFVISGVIIWVVTQARRPAPGAFILDRLSRVAPAYVLLTLGVAGLALAFPGLFPNMRLTVGHVLQSVLFIPHLDPDGRPWPVIVAGWTLTFEMFFYVMFACALLVPLRARAWWCTVLLGGFAACGAVVEFGNIVGQVYTDSITLEFVAGIWLGVAWTRGRLPGRVAGWAAFVGGAAGLAAGSSLQALWPGMPECLYWGVPATLIVGGALAIEASGGVPAWRVGLTLGNASYAMYLVHGLVISAAWRLIGTRSVMAFLLASLLGAVAVGIAFSRTVERPATRWLRGIGWQARPAWAFLR